MNDNHEEEGKDVRMVIRVQPIEITEEGVHYCEPEQGEILEIYDMEERLADHPMISLENLN